MDQVKQGIGALQMKGQTMRTNSAISALLGATALAALANPASAGAIFSVQEGVVGDGTLAACHFV